MSEALPKYALLEVERRWLVLASSLPSLEGLPHRVIEDHYLPGGQLRLRLVNETGRPPIFKLGKKYGPVTGVSRPVVSLYLTEREAITLRQVCARSARKRRYSLQSGALDVYVQPEHPFAIFEVEFPNVQLAAAYCPPAFVAREVTNDEDYNGFALAAK